MNDKKVIFKWLKNKSVSDWLETAPEDTWEEWVQTSLDELNDGIENLVLFGPEVYFILERTNIKNSEAISELLIEFYNEELKKIQKWNPKN